MPKQKPVKDKPELSMINALTDEMDNPIQQMLFIKACERFNRFADEVTVEKLDSAHKIDALISFRSIFLAGYSAGVADFVGE